MFRYLRIAVLLTILLVVAGNQVLTESRFSSWEKPLWVTIYPVLADSAETTRAYAENLDAGSFEVIGQFLSHQAARYGRVLESPVIIQVAQPLLELPPPLPVESSGLNVAIWSLKMRWWSWRNGDQAGLTPSDIRMFVLYQEGGSNDLLERSVGIQNGSYGVVNAIASRQMTARNRIVITHELLHILGASDKYDLYTGQPTAPDGLGNPFQTPLYPQQQAEIMGGRIARSEHRWSMPATLETCVVGQKTATEISWL